MPIDATQLKLPSVNENSHKVLELVVSPDPGIKEISAAISQDPVLSATLIRYANAPMYRRMVEVTSVLKAINILGMKNVRLAVYVATMKGSPGNDNPALGMLWEHSFGVSMLAKMIARKVCPRIADDIELTALMHDMGALVLANNYPDDYASLLQQSGDAQVALNDAEMEVFGIDHDRVLAAFMEEFRLPETTGKVLLGFHTREPLYEVKSIPEHHTAIVSLAHLLEQQIYSAKGHPFEAMPESQETLQMFLGIQPDDLQNFLEDYETMLNESYVI